MIDQLQNNWCKKAVIAQIASERKALAKTLEELKRNSKITTIFKQQKISLVSWIGVNKTGLSHTHFCRQYSTQPDLPYMSEIATAIVQLAFRELFLGTRVAQRLKAARKRKM